MGGQKNGKSKERTKKPETVRAITVRGFKSISEERTVEIRPLTLLAGANSSGKSSLMQPLLLLKQTLEAPYDPGAIALDGANVKFTSAYEALSRTTQKGSCKTFQIGIHTGPDESVTLEYAACENQRFDIESMIWRRKSYEQKFFLGMDVEKKHLPFAFPEPPPDIDLQFSVQRSRCFLEIGIAFKRKQNEKDFVSIDAITPFPSFALGNLIHLPGLRGNPERVYRVAAVGSRFPGRFENYTASVIAHWQESGEQKILDKASGDLKKLGLTWKVAAKSVNATQVEIQVGRQRVRGDDDDLVNISDVGLGVSQTLPVIVALHVAQPGQLVYLEQPEIHLHPRAQWKMAEVLAAAAKRGVRVIAETHSAVLLLGVQTLVAEGKLPPELVKLHWFTKRRDGVTDIVGADLDAAGAFGDWPEDFGDVSMRAESRYLDAAELQRYKKKHARKKSEEVKATGD
jgi:predicted ATPase